MDTALKAAKIVKDEKKRANKKAQIAYARSEAFKLKSVNNLDEVMGRIERTSKFAEDLISDLKKAKSGDKINGIKAQADVEADFRKVMKLQSNASAVRSAMFKKIDNVTKGMINSFDAKINDKIAELAAIKSKLDVANMKFTALKAKLESANSAASQAHAKTAESLKRYERSVLVAQKASDDANEAKGILDSAEEGTEDYINAEKEYERLSGRKSSAFGNQTKFKIAKEINEANAEESTILVDEVKGDLAQAEEQRDEIQDDFDSASKELDALKSKAEQVRTQAYAGVRHEVRVDGAPGPVLMTLDDAAKIRALAAVESEARRDF